MFYEVPSNLAAEIDELEALVEKHRLGELDAASFRARRVPFGCYEQRRNGSFMVRIRATGGAVTPRQLGKIASLSALYGAEAVHITTRQEFQIHDVAIEHVVPILRGLLTVGLSARGGGGNTVRNILVPPDAGLSEEEVFDPSPYAFALTARLIAEPDSWELPRKLKIAFSSSAADKGLAQFNDIGFIASIRSGEKGFKVYVAGGMGRKPAVGHLLEEFVPLGDVYAVVTALKRVFDRHGNRKNRNAARLRFLWAHLGEERFVELYRAQFGAIAGRIESRLEPAVLPENSPSSSVKPVEDHSTVFHTWRKRYCCEQKEEGLYSVHVPATLGNIRNGDLSALASFLENIGQNTLRATLAQDLLLRNIPEALLGNVYQISRKISNLSDQPCVLSNAVSCTGADTCKLGICLPKGALTAIERRLEASELDLDRIADFRLNLSGCPNTCGQHMIADLGFFGQAQRKGQRIYPAYGIVAGSVHADEKARLALAVDQINAYDLPDFVADILECWIVAKPRFASFADYVDAEGAAEMRKICDKYRNVPDFEENKDYYFDWGAEEVFSLVGRGMGECSAGLFDLIEVDVKLISEQRKRLAGGLPDSERADAVYRIVLSAARMLLVTRGVETHTDSAVFSSFLLHFIQAGLIDPVHAEVVDLAMSNNPVALVERDSAVFALADAVQRLYASMDNSLRFPAEIAKPVPAPRQPVITQERDYRGVRCPMNFVKIKFNLAEMKVGERLRVLLDDGEPIENVPRSIVQEGHKVLSQTRDGDFWRVEIERR